MFEIHFKNKDYVTIDIDFGEFYKALCEVAEMSNSNDKSHFMWFKDKKRTVGFNIYDVCFIKEVKNNG